ncbi:MAG: hypothetical protein OXL37_06585 [Chloroflexota bacterium]|nr:hypothetical protein [Chloroflexota bacterium]MDE2960142.1 hypothetical protein [Chloroflexota bacterium]
MEKVNLYADRRLVDAVRCRALEEKTGLNELFRQWMVDYLGGEEAAEQAIADTPALHKAQVERAMAAVEELQKFIDTSGPKPTRDEMNAR